MKLRRRGPFERWLFVTLQPSGKTPSVDLANALMLEESFEDMSDEQRDLALRVKLALDKERVR